MHIGVLGTGEVGRTVATALVGLGHDVRMGSRTAGNPTAIAWCAATGERASARTFADAAEFGELIVNCTNGNGAVAAVTSASAQLAGKLLVDVSNPLDFSGAGPALSVAGADSVGERLQRALPDTTVVKALNTVNCAVMVDPGLVPGEHVVFVCGNDADAKARTTALLGEFGWPAERVLDIGDITGARATEGYLLLWLRLAARTGSAPLNIAIRRG